MSVLLFLIPFSFLLAGIGLTAFIYAVRSGQFRDLDSPATRLIYEDLQLNIKDKEKTHGAK